MKQPKVVIIVQARMGATRLPGKPLRMIMGRSLLDYEMERLQRSSKADQIVVATTTAPQDKVIEDFCRSAKIPFFRGSENDVLSRYYHAAKEHNADIVVRVTGDCPLIDPNIVDSTIAHCLQHFPDYDYVSNMRKPSYPRGMDTEVFSFQAMERAFLNAKRPEEREHVTLYLYEHPNDFKLGGVEYPSDESKYRFTVDTEEDFRLVEKLITTLYPKKPNFTFEDILEQMQLHPEWFKINSHIQQKPVR